MNHEDLTDSEIIEQIGILSNPVYRNLSKYHTQMLNELILEATARKLKL